MHTDPIPVASGSHRMNSSLAPQGDGRKPLPHIITAGIAIVLSLAVGHFSHLLQGQQGAPGVSTVITKTDNADGLCAYFGYDAATARTQLQITTPKVDSSGPWCAKGAYISVVPGKK